MATTIRLDAYNHLCSNTTDFWTCVKESFAGCCSHDPCHDGYCHDLTEEVLYHMPFKHLHRRAPPSTLTTTTITYTLVHVSQPTAFSIGTASKAPALASVLASSQKSTNKPSSTGFQGRISTSSLTTPASSTSSTSAVNPTAAPIPGSKKSARAIAGISLGVIAAAIIALVLLYLCVSRKRKTTQAIGPRPDRKNRKRGGSSVRRHSSDRDSFKVDDTPITPGGARLEEQRERMLSEGRPMGYRALGMTVKRLSDTFNGGGVPNLKMPTPGTRISDPRRDPATADMATGSGILGVGSMHPARVDSAGASESGVGLDDRQLQHTQLHRDVRTSWTPGTDVISVSESGPILGPNLPNNEAEFVGNNPLMKPQFNEATSRWASVTSPDSATAESNNQWPVEIGHAITSPRGMGVGREVGGTVAMSTENEVTSPVDDGGLSRPIRRNVVIGSDGFRGFDETIGGDGRWKR